MVHRTGYVSLHDMCSVFGEKDINTPRIPPQNKQMSRTEDFCGTFAFGIDCAVAEGQVTFCSKNMMKYVV